MKPPLDIAHLEAATFGDRVLQREVLGLFESQAEKLLHTIRETSGKAQSEAAHALKGAARGIGAFGVAVEAEKVEQGDQSAIGPLARCVDETKQAAAALLFRD